MPTTVITNFNASGNFGIIDTNQAKGGHMQVADVTARNAIISARRVEGMLVTVVSTHTTYKLSGGILDSNWIALTGALVTNVKDYGAIGDGVANDSEAIAMAITAAGFSTISRRVFLPPGTYKANIVLSGQRVQLIGAGAFPDSGALGVPATKLIPWDDELAVIDISNVNAQEIHDIDFLGNGLGSVTGISAGSASTYTGTQITIRGCEISRFQYGLSLVNVPSVQCDRCLFNENGTAVRMVGGSGGPSDGAHFLNCDASAIGVGGTTKAYDLSESRGIKVTGGNYFDLTRIADLALGSIAEFSCVNIEQITGTHLFNVDASAIKLDSCNYQAPSGTPVLVRTVDDLCSVQINNCGVQTVLTNTNYGGLKVICQCVGTVVKPQIKLFRNEVGLTEYYTTTGFSTLRRAERSDSEDYLGTWKECRMIEDFLRDGAANDYGELGWKKVDVNGTSQEVFQPDSTTNSPGQLIVRTSATSGDILAFFLHSGVVFPSALFYAPTLPFELVWRGCVAFSNTTMSMRVGLPGVHNLLVPNDGIWISYDTALGDTFYMAECRTGSASTRQSLLVAATADVLHTFRIRIHNAAGPVLFSVDDAPEIPITLHLPTAVNLRGPCILLGNLSAAEKDVNTDYMRMSFRVAR